MIRVDLEFVYRLHAVERMFERDIAEETVQVCITKGKVIESYPHDNPYPSFLSLYVLNERPIHVVYAKSDNAYIVITVYEPDPSLWEDGFQQRKEKQ